MNLEKIQNNGLVLLGCGKMGSAMLAGWLEHGVALNAVYVLDPYPSDWLKNLAAKGLNLNTDLPQDPAVCIIAVKPQMMSEALPSLIPMVAGDCLFVSIAAGTSIATYGAVLGGDAKIIRAMPNTPAAIGMGMTALIGNALISAEDMELARDLLSAVGQTVVLEAEAQMDAVTAVSGSGPAYVFHMIETMARAGQEQGLPADLAMQLALATVDGAGALAAQSTETASQLRANVTSPGGTTAAALDVLMDEATGFPAIVSQAIAAASARSKELGKS
ncbi:pyrroline-5-carboxylate reductase [Amylibacter marinus]|uniref:Pyrroline-5-carboxylate reductase n=1 Tax=Amylibacter marinus TaxID=1475483 RepID=A0ABQ5VRK5_9RHOB|nr:pyrroline-5-carboxylate reductase [Amylibacter marinus]GLQ33843.1 pyrroline-5-carboxylate reductase [Amylibacter marinus]